MARLWERALFLLGVVTFGITAVLIGLIGYWLFVPAAGLKMKADPLVVLTKTVAPGDVLHYELNYCVEGPIPVPIRVTREMELQNHSFSFPLPMLGYTIMERCEKKVRLLEIPSFVPPGEYHIHLYTTLEINPLRTLKQSWISENFRVVQ